LFTTLLLTASILLFNPPPGGHSGISADEIAGLGLGAAAFVGAVGYLVLRRRSSKQD
jgi:hypothetical protein